MNIHGTLKNHWRTPFKNLSRHYQSGNIQVMTTLNPVKCETLTAKALSHNEKIKKNIPLQ